MKRAAGSVNPFGLNALQSMNEATRGENIFISPLSIATALTMLAVGTTGTSLEQLKSALGWTLVDENGDEKSVIPHFSKAIKKLNEEKDIKLLIANSVWAGDLRKDYVEKLQKNFKAGAFPLTTEEPINQWTSEMTQGLIPHILDDVEPDVIGILVNAVYFKGSWARQFNSSDTCKREFRLSEGSCKQVDTMFTKSRFAHKVGKKCSTVRIPYKGEKYSMVAIVPHGGCTVSEFADGLTPEALLKLTDGLAFGDVKLYIPKFKLAYGAVELKETLKDLGVTQIYSKGNAQLEGMTDRRDAYVDAILHKCVCDVNEEGTEAAAVTAVKMRGKCRSFSSTTTINIDRPFLFVIKEDASGLILFMGLVEDPTKE